MQQTKVSSTSLVPGFKQTLDGSAIYPSDSLQPTLSSTPAVLELHSAPCTALHSLRFLLNNANLPVKIYVITTRTTIAMIVMITIFIERSAFLFIIKDSLRLFFIVLNY